MDFLLDFYTTAVKEGATRVRYADTVGIQDPFTANEAVKKVREQITIDLDYHGHNDFGMSTANAYAAFKAGANVMSCTVNGLGERAGNTPLEEIVMAVRHLAHTQVRVRTQLFSHISERVEDYSKRSVYPGKAIVGAAVHAHESGIHVDGLLKDIRMYEPYDPSEVGKTRAFVLGKSSGKRAIAHVYGEKGCILTPTEIDQVYTALKKETAQ
jgi:homocitrate synthase NifV